MRAISRQFSGLLKVSQFALLLACLVFVALSAQAQVVSGDVPAAQNTEADQKAVRLYASYFLPAAKMFGCDSFAWGSMVGNRQSITLEYVPTGDNVNSWTRMVAVNVFPLPQDQQQQIDIMNTIKGKLLGAYQQQGKILQQEFYKDAKGFPRVFVEYEIGEGMQKEHNVGAFYLASPTAAAFVQLETRGKPFNARDAEAMKSFVKGKTL